jgi:hypothetical protein
VPGRTKFIGARREKILEILAAGGSRRAAAAAAGIDHATLSRWLERGRKGAVGGSWRTFLEAVERAEGDPHLLALKRDYDLWEERPELAWKFLERQQILEPPSQPEGPVTIHLTFPGREPPRSPGEGDDDD